ncbi:MAG: helix-turn-helix domain-containing protein [Leptospiraceae bacterium]|nr:helix-turn-helix domain-containing protein [Leptospiraceae bacterium]
MKNQIYEPCDFLQPYVKYLYIQESLHESSFKVFPDTNFVLGFQYQGSISYSHENKIVPLSNYGVTGITDTYRIFNTSKNTSSVLVKFNELGASSFFPFPLNELFSVSTTLENFFKLSELIYIKEKLFFAKTDQERIDVIQNFLISKFIPEREDHLVAMAISHIQKTNGNIRISEIQKKLYVSPSSLEKRFKKSVGTSPKKYASLVKFQNFLKNYKNTSSLTDMAHTMGYYDQSHFIHKFKSFTGENPEHFFLRFHS